MFIRRMLGLGGSRAAFICPMIASGDGASSARAGLGVTSVTAPAASGATTVASSHRASLERRGVVAGAWATAAKSRIEGLLFRREGRRAIAQAVLQLQPR